MDDRMARAGESALLGVVPSGDVDRAFVRLVRPYNGAFVRGTDRRTAGAESPATSERRFL